ncbi:hypothetical protein P154DRAFT_480088 [Amniculicola lignicola CBS 123094]|uniref:MARVEL domain-containing protein n=1 Tax=Amniculicola lignicola CBS 123094 TaxID=1392246 RepID=A0A6A5X340_9PLEO|nr:hypothetical protein P154DRAFT_480088 [Amniculicola lignicola CBS 123094]
MTFSGFSFICWRLTEIMTLIPIVGMTAYFVHAYTELNSLTPNAILIMFIVSVLAAAWATGTLFLYTRAKHSAKFVAFIDLVFVGAFIGAVYELRGVGNATCKNNAFVRDNFYPQLGVLTLPISPNHWYHINKTCNMLKACFALGIMNCIFFFFTFVLALLVHRHYDKRDKVVVKRETTHVSRHHSRRSRSPRHSHHSSRRTSNYV